MQRQRLNHLEITIFKEKNKNINKQLNRNNYICINNRLSYIQLRILLLYKNSCNFVFLKNETILIIDKILSKLKIMKSNSMIKVLFSDYTKSIKGCK